MKFFALNKDISCNGKNYHKGLTGSVIFGNNDVLARNFKEIPNGTVAFIPHNNMEPVSGEIVIIRKSDLHKFY